MRPWPDIGLATIVLAALAGGAWAQTGSKSAPAVAWKPANQKVVLYTRDKPPATPGLDDLELKESVSQWGVTWTFGKPARIGQFVNGDFYVVGPVVVVKIDPAPRYGKEVVDDELDGPEEGRGEGSLPQRLDAQCARPAGSGLGLRSAELLPPRAFRPRLPIAMKPRDSLASSVSLRRGRGSPIPTMPAPCAARVTTVPSRLSRC